MKWFLRIAAALIGILVLGVLVLAALGMKEDSHRLQTSITIHRPPADVWPYLYEGDKLKVWVTWLKDVERAPGPPVVGAHQTWTMEDPNNGGAQMRIQSTIAAAEPNRRLIADLSAEGGFHGKAQYSLTDLGNGSTRLDLDSDYQFEVWIAKLMSPLIMPQARKKMNGDLERLRMAAEKEGSR